MHDKQPKTPRYFATERDIDNVLFSGDLRGVEIMLRDSILNAERTGDLKTYYHLGLKKAALPFYRLYDEGYSPSNNLDAMQVYGDVGEFFKKHMKISDTLTDRDDIIHMRGQISELVEYSLLARSFTDDSRVVPLPTRAIDDMAGTDFILMPLDDSELFPEEIQTKTHIDEDAIPPHPYVSTVSLEQLDPECRVNQWHKNSLTSCIFRELKGEANSEDVQRLDNATIRFFQLLDEQATTRYLRQIA
jgi:hypothetical protein